VIVSETLERSYAAYRSVVRSGLIATRAAEVYDYHYRHGPMGKRRMFEMYRSNNPAATVQVDSFGPRYAQLVRAGLLREAGEEFCRYTQQTVTIWDVTTKVATERLRDPEKLKSSGDPTAHSRIVQLELMLREAHNTISELRRESGGADACGQGRLL